MRIAAVQENDGESAFVVVCSGPRYYPSPQCNGTRNDIASRIEQGNFSGGIIGRGKNPRVIAGARQGGKGPQIALDDGVSNHGPQDRETEDDGVDGRLPGRRLGVDQTAADEEAERGQDLKLEVLREYADREQDPGRQRHLRVELAEEVREGGKD